MPAGHANMLVLLLICNLPVVSGPRKRSNPLFLLVKDREPPPSLFSLPSLLKRSYQPFCASPHVNVNVEAAFGTGQLYIDFSHVRLCD
jgi:hypothetical protein